MTATSVWDRLTREYRAGESAVIKRSAADARAALVRKYVIDPGPGPIRLRVRPEDLTREEQRLLTQLSGASPARRMSGQVGVVAAALAVALTLLAAYLVLRPRSPERQITRMTDRLGTLRRRTG